MAHFPVGKHMARVVDVMFGNSSNGNPQVAIQFEGDEGFYGTWYGFFTPDAIKWIRKTVRALGIEWHEKDDATFDVSTLYDLLPGREAQIVVETEEYEGKERLRVRWVNEPGGGGLRNPMSRDDARAFAADLMNKAAGRAEQKKAAEADLGGDYNLDDIPF